MNTTSLNSQAITACYTKKI